MIAVITYIQYYTGNFNYYKKTRKKIKGIKIGKEIIKLIICR